MKPFGAILLLLVLGALWLLTVHQQRPPAARKAAPPAAKDPECRLCGSGTWLEERGGQWQCRDAESCSARSQAQQAPTRPDRYRREDP